MGLGKTLIGCLVSRGFAGAYSPENGGGCGTLISCPKTLKKGWEICLKDQIGGDFANDTRITNYEQLQEGENPLDRFSVGLGGFPHLVLLAPAKLTRHLCHCSCLLSRSVFSWLRWTRQLTMPRPTGMGSGWRKWRWFVNLYNMFQIIRLFQLFFYFCFSD